MPEILQAFRKEWTCEFRAKQGLFTALLFSIASVVAVAFACQREVPSKAMAAGLLSVVLLFAAIGALPRLFLIEEDQGTFDLMRLATSPLAAFLGKLLFALLQMLFTGLFLSVLFVALSGVEVERPLLFAIAISVECVALTSGTCLCGALVSGANNRWVLVVTIALPVLLPQIAMGVLALRSGLGGGTLESGVQSLIGLSGFSMATLAIGPLLVREVWSLER